MSSAADGRGGPPIRMIREIGQTYQDHNRGAVTQLCFPEANSTNAVGFVSSSHQESHGPVCGLVLVKTTFL